MYCTIKQSRTIITFGKQKLLGEVTKSFAVKSCSRALYEHEHNGHECGFHLLLRNIRTEQRLKLKEKNANIVFDYACLTNLPMLVHTITDGKMNTIMSLWRLASFNVSRCDEASNVHLVLTQCEQTLCDRIPYSSRLRNTCVIQWCWVLNDLYHHSIAPYGCARYSHDPGLISLPAPQGNILHLPLLLSPSLLRLV